MPIDKDKLYSAFLKSASQNTTLHERIISKALDIPLPNAGVNAAKVNIGPNLLKVAVLCLSMLMAGGGAAAGLGVLFSSIERGSAPASAMESQEYEVHFWTEDGTEIEVEEGDANGGS